jgi:hypothetical protein
LNFRIWVFRVVGSILALVLGFEEWKPLLEAVLAEESLNRNLDKA